MTIKTKVTLNEHLANLDQNSLVTKEYIEKKMLPRVKKLFKSCGYSSASRRNDLVFEYIDMIFETQDYRCTHWIRVKKGEYNGLWNRPHAYFAGWKAKVVYYEIDHVHPVNAGGTDNLQNFQFLSANANQFTKCSLTYDDLLCRVDLSSRLKTRIRKVLKRRERLFKSEKWKVFMAKMEATK